MGVRGYLSRVAGFFWGLGVAVAAWWGFFDRLGVGIKKPPGGGGLILEMILPCYGAGQFETSIESTTLFTTAFQVTVAELLIPSGKLATCKAGLLEQIQ